MKDKIIYRNLDEAEKSIGALSKLKKTRLHSIDPKKLPHAKRGWYIYFCSICNGYHHTSKNRRKVRVKRVPFSLDLLDRSREYLWIAEKILGRKNRPEKRYRIAA